jgi:3-deoxy-D-manno-octulosonic-acid transferase
LDAANTIRIIREQKGQVDFSRQSLEWLSLMYFLYSALLAVAMLLTLPYWVFQMLRHGKYRAGLWERLGRVPLRLRTAAIEAGSALPASSNPGARFKPVIWVHAVSVGEVTAIRGLVEDIQRRFPQYRVVVTTTTDTGQALARKNFGEDNTFYFPMDFGFAIRPYLQTLRPKLIIIAETEFWPNFLRLAHRSGASIAVVNARISDRSWPNYNRFSWLLKKVLPNIDSFLAQTAADRERLIAIGAPPERVKVTGNLKFDLTLPAPPPIVDSLRQSLKQANAGPVLVCGSTVEGEEPLLLKAFENILVRHPRAVIILAPRHPERFNTVATLMAQMNIRFWRRSLWNGEPVSSGVFLVDTIGELAALYALADIAFVGGSLVPRGGHNIIEPALHGAPIVVGNHTENFRDIVGLFQSRDAVRVVGAAEMPLVFMELLENTADRAVLGRHAIETISSQTGATERTAQALHMLLAQSAHLGAQTSVVQTRAARKE